MGAAGLTIGSKLNMSTRSYPNITGAKYSLINK